MTRAADGIVVGASKGRGRPPRDPDEWVTKFLDHYKVYGSLDHAAEHAKVSVVTARHYRFNHPDFAKRLRVARRYFRNSLQVELVKMGRGESKGHVIAILARLKATGRKMAERYSEKAIDARVMNLTINNTAVFSEEAARQLLQDSLAQMTPTTQRMLEAGAPPTPYDAIVEP